MINDLNVPYLSNQNQDILHNGQLASSIVNRIVQDKLISAENLQNFQDYTQENLDELLSESLVISENDTVVSPDGKQSMSDSEGEIFQFIDFIIDRLEELLTNMDQGILDSSGLLGSSSIDNLFDSSFSQSNVGNPTSNSYSDISIPVQNSSSSNEADLNLSKNADGTLTDESKQKIAEYAVSISEQNGGNEVAVTVTDDLQVEATVGNDNSVQFRVPNDTIFSLHTHPPGGNTNPSAVDRANEIAGAEDVVVGLDSDFSITAMTQFG